MDQLIELLKQIQELAGVAIDALEGATSDTGGEPAPDAGPDTAAGPPQGEPPAAG